VDHLTVVVAEGSGSFATMLGGLLQANLHADPTKRTAVGHTVGSAVIEVTDTGEVVGLRFDPTAISITPGPVPDADLRIVGTADTIMGLSTVPLRFGLPDLLSTGGRVVAGRWVSGGLAVHGLPKAAPLLRTVLSLLSVIS
jgi:hypothetical protein